MAHNYEITKDTLNNDYKKDKIHIIFFNKVNTEKIQIILMQKVQQLRYLNVL